MLSDSARLLAKKSADVGASEFAAVINSAAEAIKNERLKTSIEGGRVDGGLVEISNLLQLAIIGDLHGDSRSLYQILDMLKYDKFLDNPENKLVFLGDYIDRGDDSIGVLCTVAMLKATYPNSVILLRGNHECPTVFPFSSHDLPQKILDRFPDSAKRIYFDLLSFFDLLTLGVIISKIAIIVHAGLPVEPGIEEFKFVIARALDHRLNNRWLEELLWNDPREEPYYPGWAVSRRGYGKHFGQRISQDWFRMTNTRVIIRGHEPCLGFKLDHGNSVLTIFSSAAPYPRFKAGYLHISFEDLEKAADAKALSRYVRVLNT